MLIGYFVYIFRSTLDNMKIKNSTIISLDDGIYNKHKSNNQSKWNQNTIKKLFTSIDSISHYFLPYFFSLHRVLLRPESEHRILKQASILMTENLMVVQFLLLQKRHLTILMLTVDDPLLFLFPFLLCVFRRHRREPRLHELNLAAKLGYLR